MTKQLKPDNSPAAWPPPSNGSGTLLLHRKYGRIRREGNGVTCGEQHAKAQWGRSEMGNSKFINRMYSDRVLFSFARLPQAVVPGVSASLILLMATDL
ncbi:unnamed protein product, partial [Clonostachys rosea f. rosea IK726]